MARTGAVIEDADPPDAAVIMMRTRGLNKAFGTTYTFEQVAEMDDLVFSMQGWLMKALYPDKPKKG